MAHRIGRDETVDAALRRLLRDDIAKARAELRGRTPSEVNVHRARQRLKRARSLVDVLKPAMGEAATDVKRRLAATARLLAGARDAAAAAASARGLQESVAAAHDIGLNRVVREFEEKARQAHRHGAPVGEVLKRLAAIDADIAAWPEDIDATRLFDRALARSYRKGRAAVRRARTSLATPDLHRWRKEVKDLWHLLCLSRKRLPGKAKAMTAPCGRLGELLGLDHDHAMLAERLALSPTGDPALMRQLSVIAAERRRLEEEAFAIGERLYRKKPKRFARRMRLN